MYNNPYMQNYANNQMINERIDNEIERLKQMKVNAQQPMQPITQNFQISPTNTSIKYVNSIEEVHKELTICDTAFIDKEYSTLWIKNAKGDIRTFNIEEIVPKDEKDLEIEKLKSQLAKLLKEKYDDEQFNKQDDANGDEYESEQLIEPIKNEKSTNVSTTRSSKPKSR